MTTWWSWQVCRATASRSLLVVITTSAIIAGALGYSSAAATSAARSALAGSTRSAVVVSIGLGDDASRQDRSARAALLEGFAPARVDIISSIVSEPRNAILDGTALAPRVVAIGGEWLTTGEAPPLFRLVEGHWAAQGSLDGALEVRTAAEAGAGTQTQGDRSRALVAEPAILIADEPTGQLDSDTAGPILDLVLELTRERGLTAVVATHDPAMVARADRVVELRDGRVVEALS
ncbi:P-loop NTPase family protein [Tessaracoccus antarcticus]|uniref:hypothetical protein n=1 Tax=Tessaracoccus antarcticus TaxID=2479848 RepID=UPI0018F5AB97|nr:hypothetical protein [Tessaracoccus antarcticus]